MHTQRTVVTKDPTFNAKTTNTCLELYEQNAFDGALTPQRLSTLLHGAITQPKRCNLCSKLSVSKEGERNGKSLFLRLVVEGRKGDEKDRWETGDEKYIWETGREREEGREKKFRNQNNIMSDTKLSHEYPLTIIRNSKLDHSRSIS